MKFLPALSALLFSGFVYAAPLHNLVIFGDSLSDNGNLYEIMKHQLPQSPPYYKGRFSNGPVWIEELADSYFTEGSKHLQDYAIGGAGVSENPEDQELFTLKRQVETFLLANHDEAPADNLYVIWIGGNNYLAMPGDADQAVSEVTAGIKLSAERLVAKGAKNILLINLPDLGATPVATEFDAVEGFHYLSMQHNLALKNVIMQLKQEQPEVNWLQFDMQEVFQDVVDNAVKYGFTNLTESCYLPEITEYNRGSVLKMAASMKPKATQDACDGHLFFDLVHPTGMAHKILAQKARAMLDSAGVEIKE